MRIIIVHSEGEITEGVEQAIEVEVEEEETSIIEEIIIMKEILNIQIRALEEMNLKEKAQTMKILKKQMKEDPLIASKSCQLNQKIMKN